MSAPHWPAADIEPERYELREVTLRAGLPGATRREFVKVLGGGLVVVLVTRNVHAAPRLAGSLGTSAAHEGAAAGEQQRWCDAEFVRARQYVALVPEKKTRERPRPPRHGVDPAQNRVDLTGGRLEAAAFDRAEDVALEHDIGLPAAGDFARHFVWSLFGHA